MRIHFHKVPVKSQYSFSIRKDIQPNFGTVWHYHPELELHYIKGEGVRFIGDNISQFSSGEIIFLGENLPHTWRCKDTYTQDDKDQQAEVIVIHFLPECLGKDFLTLPETYLIRVLFEKARKGLLIKGKTREKLIPLMNQAVAASDFDRVMILLSILRILAESKEIEQIASVNTFYHSNDVETARLNKVYAYTLSNFKQEISLAEISSVASLSITSFCRYFKMITKKTYNEFLIEIRISHACRYLLEDKMITEIICFESGFNNVSNFYRHFKKITGVTPSEYKKKYLNKLN